ncbi:ABC transporter transmembrane domain-containing protein [Hirsutella rhossiliensis]|uniref:ABC transporter transmembrane domain-containing protein n=1 Tax=Hirsutella rhossiliensis TaxID=111463 RepID=A0A9P8SLU9_9HYPO|nr:ABC transporter transmembrane domain-containing protein [Hirsutella rhossiliensis]KAH0967893.1 ABC transporter transmembrane domain-containing protein [Hirsutella rhossiliensis]
MGAFAHCSPPIWRVDDLTSCFQQDYLKILLPLIVIALSVARLAWSAVARAITHRDARGYRPLASEHRADPDHTGLPPDTSPADSDDDDEQHLEINAGRLALAKTASRGSIVQADTPAGQRLSTTVEELAIIGLVVVNVIAAITGAYGAAGRGSLAAAAGLLTWIYTLILASLRLFLGRSKWRIPRLWNHTASIYGLNWLLDILIFRSVIIHPSSRLTQVLVILEFALVTLLFGMALTTRKGNKTVLLEWEDGIEPSREPLASLFSLATFSWVDAIVYQGWKTTMEMDHVWNLLPKDKAAAVIADYRQLKRTGALAWHLLKFFKGMLLFQCFMAFVSGLFTFAPTLLLRAILEYVEQPDRAPVNVLWLYVIALPVLDTIRSYADGMALWTGRKICIRVRAIIVGDIYAKALRRKAAAGRDKVLLDNKPAQPKKEDDSDGDSAAAKIKSALGIGKKKNKSVASDTESANSVAREGQDAKPSRDDEQANLGTIINLMSVDSFKVSDVTAYLHFLCAAAPTQLVVCVVLLWQVMGLSAIPGLIVMALLLPVNYFIARGFNITSKNIMAATDKRINVTNEVLQNIRIIKYFAWEERFGRIIDEKRRVELAALRSRFILWAVAVATWNSVPVLITFFSFFVYTVIEKKPLYPSVAFTAISLFMLLRVPLDQLGDMFAHVQESKVSIDRVEEFLNEEETEKYEQLGQDNVDEDGVKHIGFRGATLIWGGRESVADDGSRAFRLLDMDIDFRIGKLNIIAGPTGSGKTSMLMGLLGEMTLMEGKVFCPGGRSREEVWPDPETGLADTVAYVAQAAWLVNANIRDNILFAAPYDEQRYKDVVVACALERDLEVLDHGDDTMVGEKGITLSGGQKQRISLARALYSNSAHILMDDCLSAVDSHTAQWIFTNCIKGPLMRNRTCILVTHNVQLCVPSADYVIMLDNGRVTAQGPAQEVMDSGKLGEDILKSRPPSAVASRVPSRVPSSVGDAETMVNSNMNTMNSVAISKKVKPKKAQLDPMDEGKATGSVKWPVMKLYLLSMGPIWFWVVALIVFILQQLSTVATNFWVRQWANMYVQEQETDIAMSSLSRSYGGEVVGKGTWASIARLGSASSSQAPEDVPEVNVAFYLTGLAVIGAAGALAALVRDVWIFFGSLTASRRLHNRLMAAVTRAKFKFFDVTPLGQLMNRFSKDLEAVDQEIAPVAIGVMSCALSLVVTVILIAVITPGFLVAALFISGLFYFVATLYLRASRDLKRLESVQRSPLFQQFGETLSGMTTIRAYGDERRFIRDNLAKVNTQSRPFIYLWACNRWLAFRADALGNMVSFFAGAFIILKLGKIDAGAAGISLSYAMNFTENILWLVRLYGMNEQNMNAMERVKEYLDLEQEAAPVVEGKRPPESWPDEGNVEFVDYSTRYRTDLDPVLRGISLKIQAKEKVGIVGRTGAGKSSLALAIFRALEAEKGRVVIDGIDISQIGLRDLREKITIVPQDPTLFMGTIRTNLDPFDQYTDEQVFEALRRVQLIGPNEAVAGMRVSSAPSVATNKNVFLDLSSPVSESGSNLSQGQRQLLCLARAMLKKPTVLVMDEATASIDYSTDSKIQETIRELTGTVITIAHRLQTIVDYDKVLVLDRGEVVEYGHPWELMSNEEGSFRSMCEMSGELDMLLKAAKRKWDEGRLVDVEER